jgi:hypothetical protein
VLSLLVHGGNEFPNVWWRVALHHDFLNFGAEDPVSKRANITKTELAPVVSDSLKSSKLPQLGPLAIDRDRNSRGKTLVVPKADAQFVALRVGDKRFQAILFRARTTAGG